MTLLGRQVLVLLCAVGCSEPIVAADTHDLTESTSQSTPDLTSPAAPHPDLAAVDLATSASADLLATATPPDLLDDPGPGPTQSCAYTEDQYDFFELVSSDDVHHTVRLPKLPAYDANNPQPYPLFVALHGCGDTADNHGKWSAVPWEGTYRDEQSYIALSVGGRDGTCWQMTDDPIVFAAIARVRECFWVHQKKIVIGGYSSGGQLAYNVGLSNAAFFAGILIANSSAHDGVGGASKVDAALAAAAWKINIAHKARTSDTVFPIADVKADNTKILAQGFPLDFLEAAGTHGDVAGDWDGFLLPHLAGWRAP